MLRLPGWVFFSHPLVDYFVRGVNEMKIARDVQMDAAVRNGARVVIKSIFVWIVKYVITVLALTCVLYALATVVFYGYIEIDVVVGVSLWGYVARVLVLGALAVFVDAIRLVVLVYDAYKIGSTMGDKDDKTKQD
jgi:hypothetical protein